MIAPRHADVGAADCVSVARGCRLGRVAGTFGLVSLLGVISVALPVAAAPQVSPPTPANAPPSAPPPPTTSALLPDCESPALDDQLVARLRRGEYLDVHNLSATLNLVCAAAAASSYRSLLDALALLELDESARARVLLVAVSQHSPDPALRERAAVVHAWSFLRDGDDAAFRRRLASLGPDPRLRLTLLAQAGDELAFQQVLVGAPPGPLPVDVAPLASELRAARHTKRPWLAGVLSAVIPGAGQAYAGSWQGAAVAFVLSSTLIGATGELAYRRFYVSAVAAGVAASFFYVGNIFNAADLAARRNDTAASGPARTLEDRLVPEAHP